MRGLPETITIIGGDLTGLSLAIALRKNGIPVILHEAGTYPRHRVCGEFISGVSPATLDTLGITPAFHDASPSPKRILVFRKSNVAENLPP